MEQKHNGKTNMRIAICDDDREDIKALKESLEGIWPEAEIDGYEDGERLIEAQGPEGIYDLIFLDIFLEKSDGISIGRKIKETWPDVELVFISSSKEFGAEAFEINALFYLVKPHRSELLLEIKNRFRKKHVSSVTIYDAGSRQNQDIPYHRITYIESLHNYLYIHLVTGMTVRTRASVSEFMERLDERFLRINRGVIVNMEAVEKMNLDSCQIDGLTFVLSRRQKTENRKRYQDYMFQHYMDEM